MASSFVYDTAKAGFANGNLCYWSSTTASFYVTLVTASYVPSETDSFASALSGFELSSTSASPSFTGGYNGTIRISLTSRILNVNATSHQAEFQAANVTWATLNAGTAVAYAVMQQSGSNGTSPLVAYCSLGGFPVATNGGNVTLSFANSGVFQIVDAS